MKLDPEVLETLCERAGLRGRVREVLTLLAAGLPPDEVAQRLEIATATVHVHLHRARRKIAAARCRDDRRELCRFLLEEAIPGPRPSNPPLGLYPASGPSRGERARLHGGRLVHVQDLLDDPRG